MSDAFRHGSTQIYRPVGRWRWLAMLPIGVILIAGIAVVAGFAGTPQWWWAYAIMALPTIVVLFLTRDFRRLSLALSQSGVRYDGVGYVVEAPWRSVTRPNGGRVLLLDEPDVRIRTWLGGIARIVFVLQPLYGRRAMSSMRIVPLEMFDDGRVGKMLDRFLPTEGEIR